MAENTFLGLQPYTEADAYRFKGRTEESQELFRLIVRNDYTVCYAESGEGKTSLLNAGVFPLLRQNMFFPIAITFTSDDYQRTPDSFDTIIDRCIKDSIADYNEKNQGTNIEYKLCSTDFQNIECQSALQQELSSYSWWKLRNYKPQAMGLTFTPVFVFDQFEEVFNLPGSIVWTKKFFDWLENVSSDSCPDKIVNKVREIIGGNAAFPAIKEEKDFKAVFSLRKEFIGELDYWGMQQCFIPSLKDNRYCLKALTYEDAQKVMTQQQRFEETKVKQVLHYFVQQYSREPEKTIEENLPVIPALLLSVVCDSWEKDINYFSDIDDNGVDQSLNKILEKFYDEALSTIVVELSQQETNSQADSNRNDIETAIFALVDSNGKRVRRKSSELSHLDFDAKYKEILSDKRIIKITKVDAEDYVEIVHDALCPIIAKRKERYLAAEAKKREEEKLKEQAQKMRKRMLFLSGVILIIFAFLGIVVLIFSQNDTISQREKELAQRNDSLQKTITQLEKEKLVSLNLFVRSKLIDGMIKYHCDKGVIYVVETKSGKIKAQASLSRNTHEDYYTSFAGFIQYVDTFQNEKSSMLYAPTYLALLATESIDSSCVLQTGCGIYQKDTKIKDHNWHRGGYGDISLARALEVRSEVALRMAMDQVYGNDTTTFNKTISSYLGGRPNELIGLLTFYNAVANNGCMVEIISDSEKMHIINPQFAPRKHIDVLKKTLGHSVSQGLSKKAGVSYSNVAACGRGFMISDTTWRLELCGYFPQESPEYTIMVMLEKEGLPRSSGLMCGYVMKESIDGICSILIQVNLEDEEGNIKRYYPNEYLRNLQIE